MTARPLRTLGKGGGAFAGADATLIIHAARNGAVCIVAERRCRCRAALGRPAALRGNRIWQAHCTGCSLAGGLAADCRRPICFVQSIPLR